MQGRIAPTAGTENGYGTDVENSCAVSKELLEEFQNVSVQSTPRYQPGERVEAKYNAAKSKFWKTATFLEYRSDGQLSVKFDRFNDVTSLPADRVRKIEGSDTIMCSRHLHRICSLDTRCRFAHSLKALSKLQNYVCRRTFVVPKEPFQLLGNVVLLDAPNIGMWDRDHRFKWGYVEQAAAYYVKLGYQPIVVLQEKQSVRYDRCDSFVIDLPNRPRWLSVEERNLHMRMPPDGKPIPPESGPILLLMKHEDPEPDSDDRCLLELAFQLNGAFVTNDRMGRWAAKFLADGKLEVASWVTSCNEPRHKYFKFDTDMGYVEVPQSSMQDHFKLLERIARP